jgi:hypothetical protein
MASDGQLKDWVSDKLMTLLGYSKSVVVQYVIRLGRQGQIRSSSFCCCRYCAELGLCVRVGSKGVLFHR